jgi:hypothetical protein
MIFIYAYCENTGSVLAKNLVGLRLETIFIHVNNIEEKKRGGVGKGYPPSHGRKTVTINDSLISSL